MKKYFLLLVTTFLALATFSSAQTLTRGPATVTLVAPTTFNASISWNQPSPVTGGWGGCTIALPCSYQIDVFNSACPTTLVGSTGWSNLGAPISALSLLDTTALPGSTNSYVVYVLQGSGSTLAQSAVSNCVTVTLPNVPVGVTVSGSVTP